MTENNDDRTYTIYQHQGDIHNLKRINRLYNNIRGFLVVAHVVLELKVTLNVTSLYFIFLFFRINRFFFTIFRMPGNFFFHYGYKFI